MVKVMVLDVNDNRPVFYPRHYTVNLDQDSQPGTEVVVVMATDHDSGRYGTVRYEIMRGNALNLFEVDSASGKLSHGLSYSE